MRLPDWDLVSSGACRGTLMMTPLPVPSHSRLQLTCRAVIRTKEKPSFPVPEKRRNISVRNSSGIVVVAEIGGGRF